jgi:hypothetical protein
VEGLATVIKEILEVVRAALDSWAMTARLCLIIIVMAPTVWIATSLMIH